MRRHLTVITACAALLWACDISLTDDATAQRTATAWAEAYFNCDYHEAASQATPESARWLRFAASNTSADDLRVLQEAGAVTVTADEPQTLGDTLRSCMLTVSHWLEPAAIGQTPRVARNARFQVTVVKRREGWKVRMEGLPRSERQSRD